MKTVMQKNFANVENVAVPRSTFNRSHGHKTTFDAGYLIPIYNDLALPGDTIQINLTGFARLSTPTNPIMDNMVLETFFFAVPIRLIWEHWKNFCGEQATPTTWTQYTIPTISLNNIANETLYDYFGMPTQVGSAYSVNNLLGRAYNLIWNDWFRDENLQDPVTVDIDDGPDSISDYVLLRKNKRHDYFTSCLPWLQKGADVTLNLGSVAPVVTDGTEPSMTKYAGGGNTLKISDDGGSEMTWSGTYGATGTMKWVDTGMQVDLASATASTVNDLRQAIQIQRMLERDARSGTRYVEIIKSYFGVDSPDARMQRPEFLGGGRSPINISPIARTDSSPGALGAVGTIGFRGHGFNRSFSEHCVVIGLAVVSADLTYQEGIDRWHNIQTRYEMYWPTLAHLGEQAVLNREIYIDAATIGAGTYMSAFGYQERFADMRYKNSKITGKFRSNDANTLDSWHLGIEFGALPTLDSTFIQENPPVDRCIVTPTEPHFIFDSFFSMMHTRPMPTYAIPGYVDHF